MFSDFGRLIKTNSQFQIDPKIGGLNSRPKFRGEGIT